MHGGRHRCRGQKTALRSKFSPPTFMWVLEFELTVRPMQQVTSPTEPSSLTHSHSLFTSLNYKGHSTSDCLNASEVFIHFHWCV